MQEEGEQEEEHERITLCGRGRCEDCSRHLRHSSCLGHGPQGNAYALPSGAGRLIVGSPCLVSALANL